MALPSAIIAVTLITLISIFGFYKLFLNTPSVNNPAVISQEAGENLIPSPSPNSLESDKPANSSPKPSISKKSGSTPAPNPSPEAITLLQNNIAGNLNSNPASSVASSTISGTINLVGTAPSGTSLVIAARQTGSNKQFKVVLDGITAQNNASWSWSGAQDGVRYDLFAVLKGKSGSIDTDYASSPSSTVTAPYQGQVFIVDAGYALSMPTGTITVTCNTHTSDNKWLAVVNYPAVSGAQMYKLHVGTTSGGSDVVDSTKNAQTADVIFNANIVYYASYAVASVSNPTSYQYSPFSSPQIVRC